MRGWKVVWAGALACQLLAVRAAHAQFEDDPEASCRTIRAFNDRPSIGGQAAGSPDEWLRFVRVNWAPKLEILRVDVQQTDEAEPSQADVTGAIRKKMAPGACVY